MRPPYFFLGTVVISVLFFLVGCATGPRVDVSSIGAKSPDLKTFLANEPSPHAYQVRVYQIRHVWGGESGYVGRYRACISLWSDGPGLVAELYFHDAGQRIPGNPDPRKTTESRPYSIHLPMSALDSILHELRFARSPVYLFYYHPANEDQWAVGVLTGEAQLGYIPPQNSYPSTR